MKTLKLVLAVVFMLCMALNLCACQNGSPETTTTQQPAPTTTAPATTPTTEPEPTSDGKVDYTVTVVYPDGTPVVGAYVQVCLDEMCFIPQETDENGVVVFRLAEKDGYKTKLETDIEGYVPTDYIYFESGSTEITIQLVAAE